MDISLVIPAYNAAEFVRENVNKVLAYLDGLSFTSELLVIDDGSVDGTLGILREIKHPKFRLLNLESNSGKFAALKLGMAQASGSCRIFTDIDLPYDLSSIAYIARQILERKLHVVIGDRTLEQSEGGQTQRSWLRVLTSEMFSFFVRTIVTGGLFDTQCGLKGFRGDVAKVLFPLVQENGFAGDVEALYIALKYNLELKRIPVRLQRQEGSTVKIIGDGVSMFLKIVQLRSNWDRGLYCSSELRKLGDQAYWK